MLIQQWRRRTASIGATTQQREDAISDIFAFNLRQVSRWLVDWGKGKDSKTRDKLYEVVNAMWVLECAYVVSAIWRWNVDRVHGDGNKARTIAEAVAGCKRAIREAFVRYIMQLYPLDSHSKQGIDIAMQFRSGGKARWTQKWKQNGEALSKWVSSTGDREEIQDRAAVAACGSNGLHTADIQTSMTALGPPGNTNNVAEFVGLHRLLARAAEEKWT